MSKKIAIRGKSALVSGASRGIGRALVAELLARGARTVYAGVRDLRALDEEKRIYGERLIALPLDVTDEASIRAAAARAREIEILINNAGVLVEGGFSAGNVVETLRANLEVNLWGVVRLTDALLVSMQEKRSGAIVIVSSVVGLANMKSIMAYSITKAAVHSMTQGLRAELNASPLLVTGVYPGPVDTDMTKGMEIKKAAPREVAKNIAQGIEDGIEDIFPDEIAKNWSAIYTRAPKELEEQFSNF